MRLSANRTSWVALRSGCESNAGALYLRPLGRRLSGDFSYGHPWIADVIPVKSVAAAQQWIKFNCILAALYNAAFFLAGRNAHLFKRAMWAEPPEASGFLKDSGSFPKTQAPL